MSQRNNNRSVEKLQSVRNNLLLSASKARAQRMSASKPKIANYQALSQTVLSTQSHKNNHTKSRTIYEQVLHSSSKDNKAISKSNIVSHAPFDYRASKKKSSQSATSSEFNDSASSDHISNQQEDEYEEEQVEIPRTPDQINS